MFFSTLDIFKRGIGPSSSHTVGPMKAAAQFVAALAEAGLLPQVARIGGTLYGSLAATGRGHGTYRAIGLGLMGCTPDTVDPSLDYPRYAAAVQAGRLPLAGGPQAAFTEKNLRLRARHKAEQHPNVMELEAQDAGGAVLLARAYVSVGGGFVRGLGADEPPGNAQPVPHAYASGDALLATCQATGLSIAQAVLANEHALRPPHVFEQEVATTLDWLHAACVRGIATGGTLPGGLGTPRRAAAMHATLEQRCASGLALPELSEWATVFAIGVNEENAAGGKVVTAPTNGAAGLVPGVLHALRVRNRIAPADERTFLYTAAAIGGLFKLNGSLSGAEVGCQGEVGVAASMAAAGLAAVWGGTPAQVENAAEIAMEHHLGLTCDPVGGLVQVPCIERNAIGAVKAIAAARIALLGSGSHLVSLDTVTRTMLQTGRDMHSRYKETSRGGLAVSMVAC